MIHRGDVLARITADLKAGIRRITGQPDHYMNKMSSARVERALREGKRLPPENHPHSALPHVGENVAAFSELHQILRVGAAAYV
jgi:hypothetical protein